YLVAAAIDPPAGDWVQCGCSQRFAGAQAETGVMPRTSNRVSDNQPLGKWSMIVGALRSNREDLVTFLDNEYITSVAITSTHDCFVGELLDLDAGGQITRCLIAHLCSPEPSIDRPIFIVAQALLCVRETNRCLAAIHVWKTDIERRPLMATLAR